MRTTSPSYTLTELAGLADVTPRTVRYYISQGLLPSPGQVGPGTRYTNAHLERLRLIRKLQRDHLPLAEIRRRLAGLDDTEVAALGEPEPPTDTAAAYIRSVLGAPAGPQATPPPRLAQPLPVPTAPQEPEPNRSQWERITLAPDVELHVRRPLTRLQNRRVDRLVTIARELLEEDQP